MNTFAPLSSNDWARPYPIPRVPPVTMATLPLRSRLMHSSCCESERDYELGCALSWITFNDFCVSIEPCPRMSVHRYCLDFLPCEMWHSEPHCAQLLRPQMLKHQMSDNSSFVQLRLYAQIDFRGSCQA